VSSWATRRPERGLYSETTISAAATASSRDSITSHGVSRSESEIEAWSWPEGPEQGSPLRAAVTPATIDTGGQPMAGANSKTSEAMA